MTLADRICQFRPFLIRYAHHKRIRPQDVEDLVQDTLLRAWRFQSTFKGSNDHELRAWLSTIMMSLCCTAWRRRKSLQKALPNVWEFSASDDRSLDYARVGAVLERIAQLPDPQREAMSELLQGLEYAEIAENQGVAIGTVKSRLSRARAELADM